MRLLLASRSQLLFLWRHLPPQHLQVGGDAGVLRVLMQRAGEPAIRSWQIAADAVPRGIHGSKNRFGFGVSMSRSRPQTGFCPDAILRQASPVKTPFTGK